MRRASARRAAFLGGAGAGQPSRRARGRWPTARRSPTTSTCPTGIAPAGGWPGVVVLHGLGGSKDDVAPVAQVFASHGYAALAYSARGTGPRRATSSSPARTRPRTNGRSSFFAGLPQVSDRDRCVGHLLRRRPGLERARRRDPVQGCGGRRDVDRPLQRALAAGHRAVGDRAGFANAVDARSPLIAARRSDPVARQPPAIKALAAPRSALRHSPSIKTPATCSRGGSTMRST